VCAHVLGGVACRYFKPDEIRECLKKSQASVEALGNAQNVKKHSSMANQIITFQLADAGLPEYVRTGMGSSNATDLVYKFQNKFFRNGFVFLEVNSDYVVSSSALWVCCLQFRSRRRQLVGSAGC